MSATVSSDELLARIERTLPTLTPAQARELATIVARLVAAFAPERLVVFGSHARGDARADSDVDLLMIVTESDEPGYRRDQQAYRAIGLHEYPVDVVVVTRAEFEARVTNPATLPTTIEREGVCLYAGCHPEWSDREAEESRQRVSREPRMARHPGSLGSAVAPLGMTDGADRHATRREVST